MQPLCSGSITNLHRYYGPLRLCVPHRYSHPYGASTWISPLTSERQIPTFHTKSLNQVHATFMPDAIKAVSRLPPRLILTSSMPPVLTSTNFFSTPHQWLACAHLSDSHLTCFSCLFLNAHHTGSLPVQLKVVWSLLLQAGSEGPTLIFSCSLVAHMPEETFIDSRPKRSRPPFLWIGVANTYYITPAQF